MFNAPPFDTTTSMLRVLAKGVALALLFNIGLLAAGIDPARQLVQLNPWPLFGGRERLIYPSDLANGQLHAEAQLATHRFSVEPASDDQFRVALLGESGIAGWGLTDAETLSTQLSEREISINGRQVEAYNLAYPQPSVARDVVLMDALLDLPNQPDLIIWFVTAASLDDSDALLGANRVFFNINEDRLRALVDSYPALDPWFEQKAPALLDQPSELEQAFAVQHQDLLPVWVNTLLYPFVEPSYAQTDVRIGLTDVPEAPRYTSEHPGFREMPNETWAFLTVGCQLALSEDVDLLLVNRPIMVGERGAFSSTNYNSLYSRALYDDYRQTLTTYTADNDIAFADTWNSIPVDNYTDTPLHADRSGYGILAAELETILVEEGSWQSQCAD